MWVDELEFDTMEDVATLAMIIVKEHLEGMEECLEELEREPSLQQQLFDIPANEQSQVLSIFKCPLIHIIPTGDACRERTKVFHSLFPHYCALNSLV